MPFERTEHEPKEYDPEEDFRDPDSDSLTIPRIETSEADVPGEIRSAFWIIVLTINAAILAVSIGLLLLAFDADVTRGGVLLVGGLALFGLAWRRYRTVKPTLERDRDDSVDADDADEGAAETDSVLESETDSPDRETDDSPDSEPDSDRDRDRPSSRP